MTLAKLFVMDFKHCIYMEHSHMMMLLLNIWNVEVGFLNLRNLLNLLMDDQRWYYRKISNIGRTKFQNWNDSRLVLQLSLPNLLKPGVKLTMKM